MAKPEGAHYSVVWLIVLALAALASLPLDVLGWYAHWHYLAPSFALAGFSMFFAAETAAGDSAPGTNGTFTNFMYARVQAGSPRLRVTSWATFIAVLQNNWQRILAGIWLSALIGWRINPWLGGVFMLWLPLHYSGTGPGFMDRFFTWLGHRFGRNIRTY